MSARASASRLSIDADTAPFSILDSMPADKAAWSASSAPVKSSLRRRLRTCVPIASAIERLAAGCGASEPVLSGLPSRFGAGAWSFDFLAFGARVTLAMNRLLFHTQGLPGTMRALPPFAAKVSTLISPQETRPALSYPNQGRE